MAWGTQSGSDVAAATVLGPVFEPGTSEIRSRGANHLTPTQMIIDCGYIC
jgi:hypothetical protein